MLLEELWQRKGNSKEDDRNEIGKMWITVEDVYPSIRFLFFYTFKNKKVFKSLSATHCKLASYGSNTIHKKIFIKIEQLPMFRNGRLQIKGLVSSFS